MVQRTHTSGSFPLSNASFSVVLCDRFMLTTVAVILLSTTRGKTSQKINYMN